MKTMYLSTMLRIFPKEIMENIEWNSDLNIPLYEGDVVKVKVKKYASESCGLLNRIELADNSVVDLEEDDEFIGVIGNRCTVDYLSGIAPKCNRTKNLYTLSIGGIIGEVTNFTLGASKTIPIEILSIATINGSKLNTINYYLKSKNISVKNNHNAKVVVVIGDGRSSGKTATVAKFISSLSQHKVPTASMKLTGIARKRDILSFSDEGSCKTIDFIDCGLPSSVINSKVYTECIDTLLQENIDSDFFWICELGGGLLSEYNVENAISLLEKSMQIKGYVICARTRTASYGCYSLLKKHLNSLGINNKEIYFSGAITNSEAGIKSIRLYSSNTILNIFEDNDAFYDKIKKVLQ